MYVPGKNAFHGDSAACLIRDGEIVAAAEEGCFSRINYWVSFPSEAIRYCLAEGAIGPVAGRAEGDHSLHCCRIEAFCDLTRRLLRRKAVATRLTQPSVARASRSWPSSIAMACRCR